MKFTGLDVVAYVAKGCSNHSPGPMEMFKTEADDKSISNYDPSGRPILLIPKAQITMQGIQVPLHIQIYSLPWTKTIRTT